MPRMPTVVATISCASAPTSAPSSPNHRLKFLCSHGGKILPRPGDGQLKYVGGETRVISVPRNISFPEVMKRLTYLIDGEMILKYQLVSDDLDALVSVKSDEDLGHMFDEIEHYGITGSPRMRAFLFPANNFMAENQTGPLLLEQRYIYSINGINTKQIPSLPSSACSSPRSPDSWTYTGTPEASLIESLLHNNMYKTQSSQQIRSQYSLLHSQSCHGPGRNGAAPERLVSVRSVGRGDAITAPPQSYYASREINRTKCMQFDACTHFSDGRNIQRQATLP